MRNAKSTKASPSRFPKTGDGRTAHPPLKLFLSYAHEDQKGIAELRKDLKLMERKGLICIWSDHALTAGELWEQRILQELNEADIIICQLSRDFLYSEFCTLIELDTAIERKKAGEAELVAYVFRNCGWQEVPKLKDFVILPNGGRYRSMWTDKDEYWRAIAEGIHEVIRRLRNEVQDTTVRKKM